MTFENTQVCGKRFI